MTSEVSFLYYKKPAIGTIAFGPNGADACGVSPVQLIFDPTNDIGIGIPFKSTTNEDDDNDNNNSRRIDINGTTDTTNNRTINDENNTNETNTTTTANNNQTPYSVAVICTGPEETIMDRHHIKAISLTFICLALINFIITILMFYHVSRLDASLVVKPSIPADHSNAQVPNSFQLVPRITNNNENANFAFILINLIIGVVSVYKGNSLGISIYCIFIVFNFIFSTSALVNFVYSLRYLLDAFLLYFALIIRAKMVYNFLPVHVRLD